jgi:hypothetical protein
MKALLTVIALAAFLAGCGTIPADTTLDELRSFTATDAKMARLIAEKSNDEIAVRCYAYLEQRLTPVAGEDAIEVKGALSAYQLARNARRAVTGDDEQLRLACAPLALDSPLIRRLLTLGGVGAILTGGM